jgi:hypothetical protein
MPAETDEESGQMRRLVGTGVVCAAVILGLGASTSGAAEAGGRWWPHWHMTFEAHTHTASRLIAVTAVTARDAWAVGSTRSGALILRWNGSRWQQVTVPGPAGFQPSAVAASSSHNVWITGTVSGSVTGTILHLGRTGWQQIALPAGQPARSPVVVGPHDVWVLGTVIGNQSSSTATLLNWDGTGWTPFYLHASIYSLAGSGPDNVWAVGWQNAATSRLVTYKWNGSSWSPAISMPHPKIETPGITAVSPHDVWIGSWLARTGTPIVILHWTGWRWREHITPIQSPTRYLYARTQLVADRHGGLWMGPWVHWTGRTWTSVPPGTGMSAGFYPIAITGIPGTDSLWGAGTSQRARVKPAVEAAIGVHGTLP